MHPLLILLIVPAIAVLLLLAVLQGFAFINRRNDQAGIEEARKIITAQGFDFQKCQVGAAWFTAHFTTAAGSAKARFRYNRTTGLRWEHGTLEKSMVQKSKRG